MFRCHKIWSLCIGLVSMFASAEVSAQASWKLYDLRDLVSALPPLYKDGRPVAEPGANVDDVMGRVCEAMGAGCTRLVSGVFGIEADDVDHARLHQMLTALRNLYRERYAIDLVLYEVESDDAPQIGGEVKEASPMARQRLVVSGRTPTRVAALSQATFLSGVTPVVATSAVAYAVEKKAVDDGLDLSLLVGADGEDEDGATSIEVMGEVRKVDWTPGTTEFRTAEGAKIDLKFPIVQSRSVHSFVRVKLDKLVVISVLPGFEEGSLLVLAAAARKL